MNEFAKSKATRINLGIQFETYTGNEGEIIWDSNDRPVPIDYFTSRNVRPPKAQKDAVDKNTREAIAEYIKGQANRSPEQIAEERFEATAAFGAGEKIVNIITGERFITGGY